MLLQPSNGFVNNPISSYFPGAAAVIQKRYSCIKRVCTFCYRDSGQLGVSRQRNFQVYIRQDSIKGGVQNFEKLLEAKNLSCLYCMRATISVILSIGFKLQEGINLVPQSHKSYTCLNRISDRFSVQLDLLPRQFLYSFP